MRFMSPPRLQMARNHHFAQKESQRYPKGVPKVVLRKAQVVLREAQVVLRKTQRCPRGVLEAPRGLLVP